MLPSIQTPAKRQHTPTYRHSRHHSKELLSDVALKRARKDASSPFLPLLYDSSLTSFTSKNSNKSRWENQNLKPGMSKMKHRGGGFRDHTSQQKSINTSRNYSSSSGVKTQDLQLRFQSAMNVNKGWSIKDPNPRLQKLQGDTGKINAGLAPFSFRNIDDYSLLKRTLAAPHVDYLYHHKHSHLIEERHVKTSGVAKQLNDRFSIMVSTTSEGRPRRLPEISTPPIRPLEDLNPTDCSSAKKDELIGVRKKSCGCSHNDDKARSIYNRWERQSVSVQRKKSLKNNSSSNVGANKSRVMKPIDDKLLVSPPKISQKKLNREISLENLRRKAKKVLKQNTNSQDSIDKRRRSLQNAFKSSSSVKTKNSHETKTATASSIQELATQEEENDTDGQIANDENKDVTNDVEPDLIMMVPGEEAPGNQMSEEITVVDTVSSMATPTTTRPVTTPRILKMNHRDDESNADKISALRETFKKLDNDGDGHLSFDEVKQGLPIGLTKRQLDYLKKIYLMACESTFFGFEEFASVNQMCDVLVNVSPCVLDAYNSIDISDIEEKLQMYMELSTYLDRKQKGSLDISSFKELLTSAMNLQENNDLIDKILSTVNKADDDVINRVELLVYIPYLIVLTPT